MPKAGLVRVANISGSLRFSVTGQARKTRILPPSLSREEVPLGARPQQAGIPQIGRIPVSTLNPRELEACVLGLAIMFAVRSGPLSTEGVAYGSAGRPR